MHQFQIWKNIQTPLFMPNQMIYKNIDFGYFLFSSNEIWISRQKSSGNNFQKISTSFSKVLHQFQIWKHNRTHLFMPNRMIYRNIDFGYALFSSSNIWISRQNFSGKNFQKISTSFSKVSHQTTPGCKFSTNSETFLTTLQKVSQCLEKRLLNCL